LSIREQCTLLDLSRSSLYYKKQNLPTDKDLKLMKLIDQQYLKTPFFGSRRMTDMLKDLGHRVNRKHVQRLMRLMGIEAIYPKPNTSRPNKEHKVYPYLLRNLKIDRPNQVWAIDITYIPMKKGFQYLVAIIDWYSRYIISWRLSNSLDKDFCIKALEDALKIGSPEIFNSDQGCQFTSTEFTDLLKQNSIQISMDSKGRCLDNIIIERFWRSLKYEEVYLKAYANGLEAKISIAQWIAFYNNERPHQGLQSKKPQQVFTQNNLPLLLDAA
jgi:putative transposase